MGRKKNQPRIVPEQDKRICASICFCQLTMVLSCVAIVYLWKAVYSPSLLTLQSGYEIEPVMCQTIDMKMATNCTWHSCTEWCITKASGFCPQIRATVRRNGTEIQFNNCTRINTTQCPQVDPSRFKKFNCNNGTVCSNLHGLFGCSKGHCRNISEYQLCHYKPDGPHLDPEKDNTKLNGYFECRGSYCVKVKSNHFPCDRYCSKITTSHINVLFMEDNSLITAECEEGYALTESKGNLSSIAIPPTKFWEESDGTLLANCMRVDKDDVTGIIRAIDCVNGTLLNSTDLPQPFMNFTQFWKIYENSSYLVDPTQKYLPKQSNITIYQSKNLGLNLARCVNTLRGECQDFTDRFGSDGDNNTAESRYPCFYTKQSNEEWVVVRYDLEETHRFLLVSFIVPTVLFVLSSITLCVVTKSVKVGDDTKMRCVCCGGNNDDINYGGMHKSKSSRYEIEEMPEEINEQIDIQSRHMDSHEMIGSTKSLIPLSPCEETIEKNYLDDKNPTKSNKDNDENSLPLVII